MRIYFRSFAFPPSKYITTNINKATQVGNNISWRGCPLTRVLSSLTVGVTVCLPFRSSRSIPQSDKQGFLKQWPWTLYSCMYVCACLYWACHELVTWLCCFLPPSECEQEEAPAKEEWSWWSYRNLIIWFVMSSRRSWYILQVLSKQTVYMSCFAFALNARELEYCTQLLPCHMINWISPPSLCTFLAALFLYILWFLLT